MQALLLATGESQKLRPLTERIPSPMIPVMNRPIMVYNLELLGRMGFKNILVSVHSLASSIEKYFGDGQKWGLSLEYLLQRDEFGSAGALRWAKRHLQEDFIVMPADQIGDFEIAQAVRCHVAQKSKATVIVQPGPAHGRRVLRVDAGWRVCTNGKVPAGTTTWIDTGIYLFDPCVLDRIPPRLPFEIHHQLLPKLVAEGIPVLACHLPGYWNPLDTLQDFVGAQHVFLAKALKEKPRSAGIITYRYDSLESRQIYHGVWAGRNVKIQPSARISPMVSIGNNSWIGRETEVGPSAVIGSNVVIDQGATVRQSIILDDTYVGKLVHLENRLVELDQMIDLSTNEKIRVADPILLGKVDSNFIAASFKHPLDFLLALLFLLISLPLTLPLAVLLRLTTGRVFRRVPCWSVRSIRRNSRFGRRETFNLLHFNTCSEHGEQVPFGRWVESWEGQRLPELLNVLKGDLALIGLKPVVSEEEGLVRAVWQLAQDEAPVGFTGLWYVQPGSESPLEENLVADAYYLATRNWTQDCQILLKTPSAWYHRVRNKAAASESPSGDVVNEY